MIAAALVLLAFAIPTAGAQGPVIDAAPTRLTFIVGQDRSAPLPQHVRITNVGGGHLAWRAIPSAPWIRLSPTTGAAPSDLTVAADPARLGVGEHRGRVTISRDGGGADPVVIDVVLRIVEVTPAAAPAAETPADPTLDLSAVEGATEPVTSTVTLNGPGGEAVSWRAQADQPWVAVEPMQGTTPARLTVSASPRDLPAGAHEAVLRFLDAGGQAWLTVPVRLSIGGTASALAVGGEMPAAIRNLPYSQAIPIRGGQPPYAVRLIQGRLPLGFAISGGAIAGTARQAGTYAFVVSVTDSSVPPVSIVQPVALRVNVLLQNTALSVAPASLDLVSAGGRPATGRLEIASGTQALAWTATSEATWLKVVPGSGLGRAVVRLEANPGGLTPGVHVATLTVTMDGAPNSPARIPIQLMVRP